MDKSAAINAHNKLKIIIFAAFNYMSKKFVNSVVVKSRKKMVFFEGNNDTNVMFVVVTFLIQKA